MDFWVGFEGSWISYNTLRLSSFGFATLISSNYFSIFIGSEAYFYNNVNQFVLY
jgi:hypothetical protein